ncbi:hypothetical protein BH09VER1_BH09VER1_16200 [soil metagenome]
MYRIGIRGPAGKKPAFFKKVGFRMAYIREYSREVAGKKYKRFYLHVADLEGRHGPIHFSNQQSAVAEFERVVASFPEPEPLRVDKVTLSQREEDATARKIAASCGFTVGGMAHTVQYVTEQLKGTGSTVQDAVAYFKDYLVRHRMEKPQLFSSVCNEIIAPLLVKMSFNAQENKAAGKKGNSLSTYDRLTVSVLQRASEAMGGYINLHTSTDIVRFLMSLEGVTAANTIRDYYRILKRPYILAVEQGYIMASASPAWKGISPAAIYRRILESNPELARKAKEKDEEDEEDASEGMYTAEEANRIMYHFKSVAENATSKSEKDVALGWLFILTLRKHFGIRMSEIWKLLKSKKKRVNFETASIHITKFISKTGQARFLPIWEVTMEWLQYASYDSAIAIANKYAERGTFSQDFNKLLKKVPGLTFVKNGLRDSAVSHLFVLTKSESYTLNNNGHDFKMMLGHYLHAVTDRNAALYFQNFLDADDPRNQQDPLELISPMIRKMMRD